jgi:hypothetical protein
MDNFYKVQIHCLERDLARVTTERDTLIRQRAADVEALNAVQAMHAQAVAERDEADDALALAEKDRDEARDRCAVLLAERDAAVARFRQREDDASETRRALADALAERE